MSYNQDKIKQFTAFITGKMTPEQEAAFRQALPEDQEFQAIVEDLHHVRERTKLADELKQRRNQEMAELQKLPPEKQLTYALDKLGIEKEATTTDQHDPTKTPPSKYRVLYRYAAVAAIAAIVAAVWFFVLAPTPTQIVTINYEQYTASRNTMGGDINEVFSQAESLFLDEENYQAVVDQLLSYPNRNMEMDNLLAHAYFQLKEYDKSAALFDRISRNNSSANWNSIMAHLAADRNSSIAREKLKKLAAQPPKYPYRDKAIEVMQSLK